MGVYQDERKDIESYLNTNFTTTAIKFDNVNFDQRSKTEFVDVFIRPGRKIATTVGGDQITYESRGQLVLSIFVKKGIGTDRARKIADDLQTLFLKKQVGSCTFESSELINVGEQEEWYRNNLYLYYRWKKCI